ncbi:MAG: hypothetical protein ACOYI2_02970 [Bacillota bacterium]|jgi:hypothetical protein|nr:hypothetical protein [Clostridia bacterium]
MNKSFVQGIIAGSILGTLIGMISTPQKKPVQEAARKIINTEMDMGKNTRKVLKGIRRNVSQIIK